MSKTLQALRTMGHIGHIDDERSIGNCIIVTLAKPFQFKDEPGCGVRGFDTVAAARNGCALNEVERAA